MYRKKEDESMTLFPELFTFGERFDRENEWCKVAEIVPWERLEGMYRKYFSEKEGRVAKDARLVLGMIIVKHRKRLSDRDVVQEVSENIYVQYLCGFTHCTSKHVIHASTLSKIRGKVGAKFFEGFEGEVVEELRKAGLVNGKTLMIDATVVPADITYPTDMKVVEQARVWLCKTIGELRKAFEIRKAIRTYCRKGRAVFLKYQKKRKKSVKLIKKGVSALLRYVKRNMKQLGTLIEGYGWEICRDVKKRYEVVKRMYAQQREMIREKKRSVEHRIVSVHQPQVRPIVRGKEGKEVEFGAKITMSRVGGYGMLDKIEDEAYNEASYVKESLRAHKKRFGTYPKEVIADQLFGTRWNRKLLKRLGIRAAFKPLGRKSKLREEEYAYVKKKQRERNAMEGIIGTAKRRYGLERNMYRIPGGTEIWTRMSLMVMNLRAAAKEIEREVVVA